MCIFSFCFSTCTPPYSPPPFFAQCPTIVSSSPSTPGVFDLSLSSVGLKWHQLLSPFSSREWCSVFSTSPHSCRERQRLNLNTVFCLWIFVCLLEMVFCIIMIFFLLREWELTRHKPKIYYLTTPSMELFWSQVPLTKHPTRLFRWGRGFMLQNK